MSDVKQMELKKADWECPRCTSIRDGRGVEDHPGHFRRCPFRDTGKDPQPALFPDERAA